MSRTPLLLSNQSGSALPTVLILTFLMLILSASALQFGAQDASLAAKNEDSSQALYVAEAGLARALTWLEAQDNPPPGLSPIAPFGVTPDTLDCGLYRVSIIPDAGNLVGSRKRYTITSLGSVGDKTRALSLTVGTQSFAQFIYFTDDEHLPNSNTPVWFCSADLLDGPAHTNGQLHLFGDPQFGGRLTSAWGGPDDPGPNNNPAFMYYNGDFWNHLESAEASNAPYDEPVFQDGFELGTTAIDLPEYVDDLETLAQNGGIYLTGNYEVELGRDNNGTPMYGHLSYRKLTNGLWNDVKISDTNGVVFATGDIKVEGVLDGCLTLACGGSAYIMDDLVYRDADPVNGPNAGCDDLLGLVSQNDIVIRDNVANRNDCNIHGHLMALDTSFMAEYYSAGGPRGALTVHGGIIQKFRGAVGTGYLSGGDVVIRTGYAKNYHYDRRFDATQPPGYFLTGHYSRLNWNEVS